MLILKTAPLSLVGVEEEGFFTDEQGGTVNIGLSDFEVLQDQVGLNRNGKKILATEALQAQWELITEPHESGGTLLTELRKNRRSLADVVSDKGYRLFAAGTHPLAHHRNHQTTNKPRYLEYVSFLGKTGMQTLMINGLHINVSGFETEEVLFQVLNRWRKYLPLVLAMTASSAFFEGEETGHYSYRSSIWSRFPRTGIPDVTSPEQYKGHVSRLKYFGLIESHTNLWPDIRPHKSTNHGPFDRLEIRIGDMVSSIEVVNAIAEFCRALTETLIQRPEMADMVAKDLIAENKQQAVAYGLDGRFFDFTMRHQTNMRQAIADLLDLIYPSVKNFGTEEEMETIHDLISLRTLRCNGADEQIRMFKQTGNLQNVVELIMNQTMIGV